MKTIRLGIGFATGRKSFRKVLNAYIRNWMEAKKKLPADCKVSLNLFVAYDTDFSKTQSTDFTNLNQEIVDEFDQQIVLPHPGQNDSDRVEIKGRDRVFTRIKRQKELTNLVRLSWSSSSSRKIFVSKR